VVTSESRASIDAGSPRRNDPADLETCAGPVTHQQVFFLVSGIEPVAPTPKEIQKLLETTPEYGI
jgi:hypothetical protein